MTKGAGCGRVIKLSARAALPQEVCARTEVGRKKARKKFLTKADECGRIKARR